MLVIFNIIVLIGFIIGIFLLIGKAKSLINKIGVAMLTYSLLFTLPFIFFPRDRSISEIIGTIFVDIREPKVIFLSLVWLAYIISSIGMLRKKNWGRVLGTYATGLMTILSFGGWLYWAYYSFANPPIMDMSNLEGLGFGLFFGFIILIIPIGLPSLIFFILFTRPKVKEQFK